MLLDNNTKKVFDLIDMYDNLNNVDKVRLAIYLLENKNFYINFNIKDIIKIIPQKIILHIFFILPLLILI